MPVVLDRWRAKSAVWLERASGLYGKRKRNLSRRRGAVGSCKSQWALRWRDSDFFYVGFSQSDGSGVVHIDGKWPYYHAHPRGVKNVEQRGLKPWYSLIFFVKDPFSVFSNGKINPENMCILARKKLPNAADLCFSQSLCRGNKEITVNPLLFANEKKQFHLISLFVFDFFL